MKCLKKVAKQVIKQILNLIEARRFYSKSKPVDSLLISDRHIKGISGRGLFSILLETLDIMMANTSAAISIDYRTTPYNNSEKDNMWLYYFQPVKDTKRPRDEALSKLDVRTYKDANIKEKPQIIRLMRKEYRTRIEVNESIRRKIDTFIKQRFSQEKILGVHIRGTDHARVYGNCIDVNKYFEAIDQKQKQGFSKIFLATDDENFYRIFKERYGNLMITYSKSRGTGDIGVHRGAISNKSPRELGEEVLIDCHLLSRTSFFIHADSNVATMTLILSENLEENHMDVSTKKKQKYVFSK